MEVITFKNLCFKLFLRIESYAFEMFTKTGIQVFSILYLFIRRNKVNTFCQVAFIRKILLKNYIRSRTCRHAAFFSKILSISEELVFFY